MKSTKRYWLAVNGASVAVTCVPGPIPTVTPTPTQLFGLPTREEQLAMQEFLLTQPIPAVTAKLESLRPWVMSGEIIVVSPANPEPPTQGVTAWQFVPEKQEVST